MDECLILKFIDTSNFNLPMGQYHFCKKQTIFDITYLEKFAVKTMRSILISRW